LLSTQKSTFIQADKEVNKRFLDLSPTKAKIYGGFSLFIYLQKENKVNNYYNQ